MDPLREDSFRQFSSDFKTALQADGITDLSGWSSHAIRRGSGVDMLCQKGLVAMLSHGEWESTASASHYASLDEMHARLVADQALELSDDEDAVNLFTLARTRQ